MDELKTIENGWRRIKIVLHYIHLYVNIQVKINGKVVTKNLPPDFQLLPTQNFFVKTTYVKY